MHEVVWNSILPCKLPNWVDNDHYSTKDQVAVFLRFEFETIIYTQLKVGIDIILVEQYCNVNVTKEN